MINQKRCLFVLVFLILLAVPSIAQQDPASRALDAIRRARAANDGDCSQLPAFAAALGEHERIRTSNPGIGIRPHNMDGKLERMRKQCARAGLVRSLPGGTGGTNIVNDIEANKKTLNQLETDSALLLLERELIVLRLDQLRTEREALTPGTELFTRNLQEESILDKSAQELSGQIIKNEKAFVQSSKTRTSLEKRLNTIRAREAMTKSRNQ